MKTKFILLASICAAGMLFSSCGNRSTDNTTLVKVGEKAPDFSVEMFSGEKISLADLRGKVVLLNFWATWCPPCRMELARVKSEIIDRFADKEFVFLPISRGETRETVAAFRDKEGYTFNMGLDPTEEIYKLFASNYIPRNFLIDKEGKVVLASIGYEYDGFDNLIKTIEQTLK
jgi:peroxiredoxin